MKITYNDSIDQVIVDMMDRDSINFDLESALIKPISEGITFDDYESVKKHALELRARLKLLNTVYSHDESVMAAMLFNILTVNNTFSLVPEVLLHNIIRSSRIIHDNSLFTEDAYLKNIKFEGQKADDIYLTEDKYDKYELFFYDSTEVRDPGILLPKVAASDNEFSLPVAMIDDMVLASFEPQMPAVMKPHIENAAGKVLVIGCEIGYFAYMTSLKENVESVTIIESDPMKVKMFNELILPQFENGDKVTVICCDINSYMESYTDGTHDYCLVNLWTGQTNVMPYMLMKKICSELKKTAVEYYNEESLKYAVEQYVHYIIVNEFQQSTEIENFRRPEMSEDEQNKMKFFENIISEEEISSAEDILKLLDADCITGIFAQNTVMKLEQ